MDWREVLRDFWQAFSTAVGETKELRVKEVLDKLDEELGPHFFPANDNGGRDNISVVLARAGGNEAPEVTG